MASSVAFIKDSQENLHSYRLFATELAEHACSIQMRYYNEIDLMKDVVWYDLQQFRTKVDIEIGEMVRKEIHKAFPEHNIHSEELADKITGSPYTWVIDEIDGTGPYIRKTTDHFSFCIALCKENDPILGVVQAPKRNEVYTAIKGEGAFCNGILIKCNTVTDINHVWMGLGGGKRNRMRVLPYYIKAMAQDGISCPLESGCASVPLCLVASGNIEAYLAIGLEPEDMAAAVVINREAGCKVTSLEGKPWRLGDESILTANPELHYKLSEFFGIPILPS